MPRDGEPKSRVHLWLHDRDLERMDALFGKTMTRSAAVQLIIKSYLNKLDARAGRVARHLDADVANIIDEMESPNARTQAEPAS